MIPMVRIIAVIKKIHVIDFVLSGLYDEELTLGLSEFDERLSTGSMGMILSFSLSIGWSFTNNEDLKKLSSFILSLLFFREFDFCKYK